MTADEVRQALERTLTGLIFGPSGAGKSTLVSTVPAPRLLVDLEGRAKYTPNGRYATLWDGISDPMKLARSKSRTAIVTVTDIQVLTHVYNHLLSGKHPFVSVAVDSLMEAQLRTKRIISPGRSPKDFEWGDLLIKMQDIVRDFRDLTNDPKTGVKVAMFVAGVGDAAKANGYLRPLMQGQINTQLPYFMDICGYMENVNLDGIETRRLWLGQRPQNDLEVKDGTGGDIIRAFGKCITIAEDEKQVVDMQQMYDALLPEGRKETSK